MDHQVGMLLWWMFGLPTVAALGWLAWTYLRAPRSNSVDSIPQQHKHGQAPEKPGDGP